MDDAARRSINGHGHGVERARPKDAVIPTLTGVSQEEDCATIGRHHRNSNVFEWPPISQLRIWQVGHRYQGLKCAGLHYWRTIGVEGYSYRGRYQITRVGIVDNYSGKRRGVIPEVHRATVRVRAHLPLALGSRISDKNAPRSSYLLREGE
jgi:hypothetical protein